MSREFVEVLDQNASHSTLTGTDSGILYKASDNANMPDGIPGGTLEDRNSLRLTTLIQVSLYKSTTIVEITLKYGSTDVVVTQFSVGADVLPFEGAIISQAMLSADGNDGMQVGHMSAVISSSDWAGMPIGYGTSIESSATELDLQLLGLVEDGDGSVDPPASGVNVGNGVWFATPTLGPDAEMGTYLLTCTSAVADSGVFAITTPASSTVADLIVGSSYVSTHINGLLNDGSVDFQPGDTWTIAVIPASDITKLHATLEKLATPEEVAPEEGESPNTQIWTVSKLNHLPAHLIRDHALYAPLIHDMIHTGIGVATFVRASTSSATWRDGGSHSVAVNIPRFEYSGETALGMKITTASETFTIPTSNAIHDSGALFWLEDNVFKSTPNGDTNPFNSSGVYNGTTDKHISHVLKFKSGYTLSAKDKVDIEAALTTNW